MKTIRVRAHKIITLIITTNTCSCDNNNDKINMVGRDKDKKNNNKYTTTAASAGINKSNNAAAFKSIMCDTTKISYK